MRRLLVLSVLLIVTSMMAGCRSGSCLPGWFGGYGAPECCETCGPAPCCTDGYMSPGPMVMQGPVTTLPAPLQGTTAIKPGPEN